MLSPIIGFMIKIKISRQVVRILVMVQVRVKAHLHLVLQRHRVVVGILNGKYEKVSEMDTFFLR